MAKTTDSKVEEKSNEDVSNSPEKRKKKVGRKPTSKRDVPKIREMVEEAIGDTQDQNGTSLAIIKKYILQNYGLDAKHNTYIRNALKKGVTAGAFIQVKGTGASGSFKLNTESSIKPADKTKRQKDSDRAKAAKEQKEKLSVKKAKQGNKSHKNLSLKKKVKSPAKAAAKSPAKVVAKSPAKVVAKSPVKVAAKSPKKSKKKRGSKK